MISECCCCCTLNHQEHSLYEKESSCCYGQCARFDTSSGDITKHWLKWKQTMYMCCGCFLCSRRESNNPRPIVERTLCCEWCTITRPGPEQRVRRHTDSKCEFGPVHDNMSHRAHKASDHISASLMDYPGNPFRKAKYRQPALRLAIRLHDSERVRVIINEHPELAKEIVENKTTIDEVCLAMTPSNHRNMMQLVPLLSSHGAYAHASSLLTVYEYDNVALLQDLMDAHALPCDVFEDESISDGSDCNIRIIHKLLSAKGNRIYETQQNVSCATTMIATIQNPTVWTKRTLVLNTITNITMLEYIRDMRKRVKNLRGPEAELCNSFVEVSLFHYQRCVDEFDDIKKMVNTVVIHACIKLVTDYL